MSIRKDLDRFVVLIRRHGLDKASEIAHLSINIMDAEKNDKRKNPDGNRGSNSR
jgi:hypothetical protein